MELASALITTLAQGFFYLLAILVIIHAASLLYHWYSYGTSHTANIAVSILYVLGTAVLLTTLWTTISYL